MMISTSPKQKEQAQKTPKSSPFDEATVVLNFSEKSMGSIEPIKGFKNLVS